MHVICSESETLKKQKRCCCLINLVIFLKLESLVRKKKIETYVTNQYNHTGSDMQLAQEVV